MYKRGLENMDKKKRFTVFQLFIILAVIALIIAISVYVYSRNVRISHDKANAVLIENAIVSTQTQLCSAKGITYVTPTSSDVSKIIVSAIENGSIPTTLANGTYVKEPSGGGAFWYSNTEHNVYIAKIAKESGDVQISK